MSFTKKIKLFTKYKNTSQKIIDKGFGFFETISGDQVYFKIDWLPDQVKNQLINLSSESLEDFPNYISSMEFKKKSLDEGLVDEKKYNAYKIRLSSHCQNALSYLEISNEDDNYQKFIIPGNDCDECILDNPEAYSSAGYYSVQVIPVNIKDHFNHEYSHYNNYLISINSKLSMDEIVKENFDNLCNFRLSKQTKMSGECK